LENPLDKTFNIRQTGLNTDFMSYAALALQDNNIDALLDPETLFSTSNKVFATFFQHFAGNNISFEQGSYGFQPVGATLPWDLPLILGGTPGPQPPPGYQDRNATHHLSTTVDALIQVEIQQLHMSPAAVYLCLAILSILLTITGWVYTRHRQYFKALPRDVDSLASILGFVHASPKLLKWVEEHKYEKDWGLSKTKKGEADVMASMGWFDGDHWGIELLEERATGGFQDKVNSVPGNESGSGSSNNNTVEGEGEALAPARATPGTNSKPP